ncbi:hypothetical protein L6452_32293 [Arctium lappa]|uniref:Uncharacterized protein n=1 Tax=Arctium lappa TaxID=4217 RepID=A0ACB8Z3X8_ARCLA|nr:hypothetical protein L6452_32293 [Arctium lappa]
MVGCRSQPRVHPARHDPGTPGSPMPGCPTWRHSVPYEGPGSPAWVTPGWTVYRLKMRPGFRLFPGGSQLMPCDSRLMPSPGGMGSRVEKHPGGGFPSIDEWGIPID